MRYLPLLWILGGILLSLLEFWIPGFVVFFFGTGAVFTGVLCLIFPGLANDILFQVVLWVASSFLSFALLRRFLTPLFGGKLLDRQTPESVGRTALVTEEISPERPGRIRFQGTTWEAVTYDEEPIPPGTRVLILEQEGLRFAVTRQDDDVEED
ncbi:NfeD family protein [Spirochaeta thermophila]|uniref:NfeD-like C-terminal domain-containing protein n=1 Tax=Winmispira thermophila (strain ATCC 49972 / DSM 6192 / RI 19.B1) TaxID=665571 RepID=E0RRN8_WINT6|nr:NfeD family protein [Spirochaeta thermophila]ADN03142.1 hypothetical protein STHERM_c22150 [Spirochaeta thermophila DSM 6192]